MRPLDVVKHVAVVGLMGSGKSTIGRLIAGDLGWPARDSDREIEAATGRTVRELRDELGVDGMHAVEAQQLLDALADPEPSVVCPAASTIDVEACREALSRTDVAVVWLTASPVTAAARFVTAAHRPWYGDDPAVFLSRQAASRYPRFEALADVTLGTDTEAPRAVADRALAALRRLGAIQGAAGEHHAARQETT